MRTATETVEALTAQVQTLQVRMRDAGGGRPAVSKDRLTDTLGPPVDQHTLVQDDADGLQEEVTMRSRRAVLDEKALRTLEAELTASEEAHRVRGVQPRTTLMAGH